MLFSKDRNILQVGRNIAAILLIFSTFFNISLADTCIPEAGAVARFFEYPLHDTTSFSKSEFLLRDFRKNKYLGEVTGIKNVSWDSGWPAVVPPYGFDGVPITNFLVSITAYYRAPQTGVFNVSLKADDFAAVYVGIDAATDCNSMHFYNFTADEFAVSNRGSAARGLKATTKETYMVEGWYYPIEIIYLNYMERGVLSLEMIQPDGTVDTQFGERLYAIPYRDIHFFSDQISYSTIYETFTRSTVPDLTTQTTVSTSIYTDWIEYYSADVYVFNYVDEPLPTTAPTTTTTDVSVPTTSSYTTQVTGGIGASTSAGASVPITSTYTTVVTGSFGSSSPEVFFNFDLEVEVKY